jgi:crotonobetainyl-CoA:carnitine CoA-transferase CaiB-like acyl-CoA transferase
VPAGPPPTLGQDTAALLGEWLGLSAADLELLSARGVI